MIELHNTFHRNKEDMEQQQKIIQENARAKLQNERMKLNQSLMKQNSQY